MRVAQRMISRNYRRTVNSSLKKQADTLERSESGLKFKRQIGRASCRERVF